jgi:selenocysteine-specific elongation factor
LTGAELAERANLRESVASEALERLQSRGEIVQLQRPVAYLASENARPFFERVYDYLLQCEEREPWALGCTSLVLARAFELPEPLLVRIIGAFAEEGRLANRGGYYSTMDFSPRLTGEQQQFFDAIVPANDGFTPVPFDEAVSRVKQSRLTGASRAFDMLLGRGVFVKVGDQLYRGTQIRSIHLAVDRFLRQNGRMTMAEFRDIIGTSRKYSVPLLEWFDSRGITVRSGDYRMLRKREKTAAG